MGKYRKQIICDPYNYSHPRRSNENDNNIINLYPNSYQRYCENKLACSANKSDYKKNNRYEKRTEFSNKHSYDNHRDCDGRNGYYEYNKNYHSRDLNKGVSSKAILLNIISILMFFLVGIMTIYNIKINDNENKIINDKETVFIDESLLNITSDGGKIIILSPVYKFK